MSLNIAWTKAALQTPEEARMTLQKRLERLRAFFPEVKPKMTIGITRAYDGLAFMADNGSVKLMVDMHKSRGNAWKYPTYWTLAHEMMHLAQFTSKGIPGGERACDVHALMRIPPGLIDDPPSYLVVPPRTRRHWHDDGALAKLAHELAVEALRRRKAGLRRYARWWEDEFERRAARMR